MENYSSAKSQNEYVVLLAEEAALALHEFSNHNSKGEAKRLSEMAKIIWAELELFVDSVDALQQQLEKELSHSEHPSRSEPAGIQPYPVAVGVCRSRHLEPNPGVGRSSTERDTLVLRRERHKEAKRP